MKVLIFHASAGHGHKKVAEVIEQAFQKEASETEVKVVDALDYTSKLTKKVYPAFYYYMVKYLPFLWGFFYELLDQRAVYALIRPIRSLYNQIEGGRMRKLVEEFKPDHIICTHFMSAEYFSSLKRKKKIQAVVTTVVTDFYPHFFWAAEGTDNYWVMHQASEQDLRARGVKNANIVVGGIPVDPFFKPKNKKQEILTKHGFSKERFTLLITSGSFGLGPYEEILKFLEDFKEKIQCFVVCGNNKEMEKKLSMLKLAYPAKIFGFVDFMEELMEASDLILAKPGGATTVESLAKQLPMIVLRPIPGQESRNAHLLKKLNASFFMKEPYQIKPILFSVFEHAHLIESKHQAMKGLAKPDSAADLVRFIQNYN